MNGMAITTIILTRWQNLDMTFLKLLLVLPEYSNEELKALKDHAKEQNIRLTVGYTSTRE